MSTSTLQHDRSTCTAGAECERCYPGGERPKPKSYAPEVIADSSGKWCGNALRFATREEAYKAVKDLESRWLLVRDTRVAESDEPVNYRWDDELGLVRVEE